jgi:hypothetical protein
MDAREIAEGYRLLGLSNPDLLPLDVDRDSENAPREWFVCDAVGLEFAVPRERDRETAELIAYAVTRLRRLLDIAARQIPQHELDFVQRSVRILPGGDDCA